MTTQTAASSSRVSPTRKQGLATRLRAVRERTGARGVDARVVRAAARYLHEYVPQAESAREWRSGCTGSMGEALVTAGQAFLFVDGRYHLQGDQEPDPTHW